MNAFVCVVIVHSLSCGGRLDQLPDVRVACWLLLALLLQSLDLLLSLLLVLDRSDALLLSKERSLLGRIVELNFHLVHF